MYEEYQKWVKAEGVRGSGVDLKKSIKSVSHSYKKGHEDSLAVHISMLKVYFLLKHCWVGGIEPRCLQ